MKKIAFAFTFFLLLGAGTAVAQKTFRFGLNASPTWSWLRTDDKKLEGAGSNWGLKLSAVGEYYFATNYAFTVGLGFGFNQGGNLQNGYPKAAFWPNSELAVPLREQPINAKLHYRLNYVEVPFGLHLRGGSGEDNPLKYYAEIPLITLGFLSKATGDIRGDDTALPDPDAANDINIRDEVKALAISWGLGGGIEYEVSSNTTIVAGLAYQHQFSDVTSSDSQVSVDGVNFQPEDSKATIRMLTLKLGIFF